MEFVDVGKRCSAPLCNQQDFLPFSCDCCHKAFCLEHRTYSAHQCPNAGTKDSRAIQCPICKKTISLTAADDVHVIFDRHMATECDPSKRPPKTSIPKCPVKGCRERLTTLNRHTCPKCRMVVCMAHRFSDDHACTGAPPRTGFLSRFMPGNSNDTSTTSSSTAPASTTPTTEPSRVTSPPISPAPAPATAGNPFGTKPTTAIPASSSSPTSTAPSSTAGATVKPTAVSIGPFGMGLPAAATRGGHGMNSGSATTNALFTGSTSSATNPAAPPRTTAPAARTAGAEFLRNSASSRMRPAPAAEICPTCGSGFPDIMSLIEHSERAHSGNSGFVDSSSIPAAAPVSSSGERCPYCSSTFSDVVHLVNHVESVHTAAGQHRESITVGPDRDNPQGCSVM